MSGADTIDSFDAIPSQHEVTASVCHRWAWSELAARAVPYMVSR